jgi:hypothetical protein
MEKTLETTLDILKSRKDGFDFVDLTRAVTEEARVDEATAKASILRLSFEGKLRIDSDWSVHPVAELQLVVAA